MRYLTSASSDIGAVKKNNQDAISMKIADTSCGKAVFAILCDGMGGFEQGELASATAVHTFSKWFEGTFLNNLSIMDDRRIKWEWEMLANKVNIAIYEYGIANNIKIGTTLLVLLIYKDKYYCMNVGDCRLYNLNEEIIQITKDHSWVAEQVELGNMTKEEARFDKRNNRLTQCIGGMRDISPDFYSGKVIENEIFMMCCDGVRNKVYDDELLYFLHPSCMVDENIMKNNMLYIFELNKLRHERDNMSMILVRAEESTLILHDDDREAIIEKDITLIESKTFLDV